MRRIYEIGDRLTVEDADDWFEMIVVELNEEDKMMRTQVVKHKDKDYIGHLYLFTNDGSHNDLFIVVNRDYKPISDDSINTLIM